MDNITLTYKNTRRGKKTNVNGELALVLYVYKNRKEFKDIKTGVLLKPKDWDTDKEKVKKTHKDYIVLNSQLDQLKEVHKKFIDEMNRKNNKFDFSMYKFFDDGTKSRECFISYMETEIKRRIKSDPNFKEKTITSHNNKVNNLKLFRKTIPFNELNVKLIEDITAFLKDVKKHSQNTIKGHHKVFKTYIRRAVINDKILKLEDSPYLSFKFGWEKKHVEYLQPAELKLIEKYEPKNSTMEFVKDVFLFACYTGLAYADFSKISFEEVLINEKKEVFIVMDRQKTESEVYLPVSKLFPVPNQKSKAESLLMKYYKIYEPIKNGDRDKRLFFKMSNQKLNQYLKDLAANCKINKSLTTHYGRHTFGTIMCNELEVPITIVKELMAHSDIKMTSKYVIVNDKVINAMLDRTKWNSIY